MTELEKIEYAKTFVDKLANGINPLDDTPIPEGDIVNHVRLSRCFFFVSDVLRQVIDNGGVNPPTKQPKAVKPEFTMTDETKAKLHVSESAMTVSEIVRYLNDITDRRDSKRLTTTAITGWMVEQGFMKLVELSSGKMTKLPTPAGNEIGLFTEERTSQYGIFSVVLFSPAAQTFVYDHMEPIMESYEISKAAKKEQKAMAKAQQKSTSADTTAHSGFYDRPWTETHDERLRSMLASGATISEMADTVKRTEAGIYARLRELGLQ